MWFKKLLGFDEINPDQVRENLILDRVYLESKINGKRYQCGILSIPTLADLRNDSSDLNNYDGKIEIAEIVAGVKELHLENENATFQAASQFNLLEMVSPNVYPEEGVDIYENDYTQGPACAIACGAGTIYRNYYVKLDNQIGQTSQNQVDCLKDIGAYFNNEELPCWEMRNGYALANRDGLSRISEKIKSLNPEEYDSLKSLLRVGIQSRTEVTISTNKHLVTQVYCSALPIRYSNIETKAWEPFARLVLEATYESTFYAALKNYESTGNNKLYLTLVGGGVFGNPLDWILEAIEKSVIKFRKMPLNVKVVSYGGSNGRLKDFLSELNGRRDN